MENLLAAYTLWKKLGQFDSLHEWLVAEWPWLWIC